MAPLTVRVWAIGEYQAINLQGLADRLNACQTLFAFDVAADTRIEPPPQAQQKAPPFCADRELFKLFPLTGDDDADFQVGITSFRIAREADIAGGEKDLDYFAVCGNDDPVTARKAVFSTALWEQRYELAAYRTAAQYLSTLFVSFLGDALAMNAVDVDNRPAPALMTHNDFRWCAFDYNDDLDSIVQSVRKARIDVVCERRIAGARYRIGDKEISGADALRAFKAILLLARRPTLHNVFRYLHAQAITSLAFFTILISVLIDLMIRQVSGSWIVAGSVLALFAAIMIKLHFWPSRGLS